MERRRQTRVTVFAAAAVTGLMLAAALAAASAGQKPKAQAKIYEESLQGLTGQPFGKVIAAIEDWDFDCLDAWEAVDPSPKEVTGHNRSKIKFSKKEIAEIFGPGGTFRVVVYNKLIGTDATTMGTVDSMGMASSKDATFTIEKYTVIRAVFKDDALILYRVWPVLEQSEMAGGMLFRR
ncbi:MAG TPA: hypothetical protein ENO03_01395 [Candidatus Aminicenantes bacterium]|nr:hypothetical protein [Candidatus Aminicenantes bacterium]